MGKNDFFGDGRSDIILQNTDGSVVLWEMSGTAIVNAGLVGNPGASWSVEATASGTAITPGSGSFTDSSGNVFTVSTAGLAEENGSPLPLGSGTAKLVYYDGIVYGQDVATGNWNILDGDGHWSRSFGPGFFGDGSSSIVMQNADGSVVLWDMSGTTIVNAGNVGNPGPTWHVKGTGDFFGDGHTDLVMQNADGSVVLWDMSGSAIINAGVVGNPGASWNVLDDNMRFIYSTSANETLTATPAAPDEFVLTGVTTGLHTISGFNPAQDMIELSKAQFPSFTDVQAATSVSSGVTTINLGGGSLLLPGVNADLLHASNFALT
jgi:hypothetical protein